MKRMHFDFFNSVTDSKVCICTMEKYHEAISNAPFMILAKDISVARTKEQKQLLKRQLPIVCWQASFGGKGRKNANAVPSGLYMVDFDDVEDAQVLINKANSRREELDIVYIAFSISRKGVRIVAECRPEFSTIAECQRWLSNQLGQPCDEACKDWVRASYLVPEHYVYYMDKGIFGRGPKCVYQVGAAAPQKTPEIPEIPANPEIPENPVKAENPAKNRPNPLSRPHAHRACRGMAPCQWRRTCGGRAKSKTLPLCLSPAIHLRLLRERPRRLPAPLRPLGGGDPPDCPQRLLCPAFRHRSARLGGPFG